MKTIAFSVYANPWPKLPTAEIRWPNQGDQGRAYAQVVYASEPLMRFCKELNEVAKKAMYHEPRLLDGYLSVSVEFQWARPKEHYALGVVKAGCREDLPLHHHSLLLQMTAAVVDYLPRVVFHEIQQVCEVRATKRWGDVGAAHVKVCQITPRDIDLELAEMPEQLSLDFD